MELSEIAASTSFTDFCQNIACRAQMRDEGMNTLLYLLHVCNNMTVFVSEAELLKQCCSSSYSALTAPWHVKCLGV